MRQVSRVWILLMLCAGCSAKEPATIFQPQTARSNVLAVLPSGWSVIPPSLEQQRLTAAYFTDPQTQAFILLGTAPNYVDWADKQGTGHREYLARECLYIWLMPGGVKPNFPRFCSYMYLFGPELPERIYSSKDIQVYGYVSHHIADTNRLATILKECSGISSPEIRLSWTSWHRDISASLKK
jgi:hypothetical protein